MGVLLLLCSVLTAPFVLIPPSSLFVSLPYLISHLFSSLYILPSFSLLPPGFCLPIFLHIFRLLPGFSFLLSQTHLPSLHLEDSPLFSTFLLFLNLCSYLSVVSRYSCITEKTKKQKKKHNRNDLGTSISQRHEA